jgi:hypothetical protein
VRFEVRKLVLKEKKEKRAQLKMKVLRALKVMLLQNNNSSSSF